MRRAIIDTNHCVACGSCVKACRREAVEIKKGVMAVIDYEKCVGCGLCVKACPASVIMVEVVN